MPDPTSSHHCRSRLMLVSVSTILIVGLGITMTQAKIWASIASYLFISQCSLPKKPMYKCWSAEYIMSLVIFIAVCVCLSVVDMRKVGSSRGAVTAYPRQLEYLIRLAEAHTKMRSGVLPIACTWYNGFLSLVG